MNWVEASEVVTGLALKNRISLNVLRPEIFMSPYDAIIRALKSGNYEPEELIQKIGWEPIQVAQNAEKAVNGTGNLNWVQILETSYRLYCSGQQLEKYGKKMQQGQEPDIIKLKTIFNQFNTGKSNRMPLSRITGDEIPFIETGWQVIDDHLGGLPIVGLIVVAGNPGVGKTTWMTKLATSFAKRHENKKVGVYSLEMLSTEIARRFREIDKLTPEQEDRIEINDRPLIASEVIADAAQIENLGLVIVDFADYMVRGEISESSMGEIYRTLAIGSKELECPIVLLSQLNRNYSGGIPRPNHIRYTSLAEILAWMILMLYNPSNDFYEEKDKDKDVLPVNENAAYIIAWKVRGGFRKHPDDSPGAILTPFKGSRGWHSTKSKWFSLKKEV
jgi:hypothetical protein